MLHTKKTIISFFINWLLFGLICSPSFGQPPEQLVVNTGFTPPVSTIFHLVMTEAGQRLGIEIDFQELPAERSLMLVSAGIDDAECCRIPSAIQQDYPDLINVPVSFFTARFSAFSRDKTISINNWQDLKPYSVGVTAGWKILVTNVAKVEPREYLVLDTAESMFSMLGNDRIDIATLGYLSGLSVIHYLNVKNIHAIEPPLASKPLYMQLHKKHADLAPKFAQVFEEMKADGTIEKIEKTVLNRLQ